MLWGPNFKGRHKILLMVEALKFWELFQKFTSKLLNSDKLCIKFPEEQSFRKTFVFLCPLKGKTGIITYFGYIGVRELRNRLEVEKFQ